MRTRQALGAAALFALVVVPIALAGAAGDPQATTGAGGGNAVKKLKKKVNTLTARVAALEGKAPSAGGAAGGDLTGTYPNPSIAPNSVGNVELDESNLSLVSTDVPGCCSMRAEQLATATAYSAGNPLTFVDFGSFEIRSLATGEIGQINVCNTGGSSQTVFHYTGGSMASTAESRIANAVASGVCEMLDTTGADDSALGDFRISVPVDQAMGFGFSGGTADAHTVFVFDATAG